MTEVAPLLGVLAGAIGVADMIPYVRDTLRGTTRPHRGTWLIWGALAIVVCFSQRADGASWSLIMVAAGALLNSLIFALSFRRGVGGVTTVELVMIVVAGGGVVGWLVADEPVVATACVVAADLIGAAMMVPKTYRDPRIRDARDVRVREPRRRTRRRCRRLRRPLAAAVPRLLLPDQRRDRAADPPPASRPGPRQATSGVRARCIAGSNTSRGAASRSAPIAARFGA